MKQQQKYVPVSSCTVHDKTSGFYLGTPASATTKTGRHDIAETLLKVGLGTISQIKSNHISDVSPCTCRVHDETSETSVSI
jgi:hypothetical protein